MNCEAVQTGNVAERYVLGGLSEPERNAFEEHYFECDRCLDEVRMLQSLQGIAAERSRKVVVMPRRRNWAVWGAVAAMVVVGLGIAAMWRSGRPAAQPIARVPERGPDLQLLAKVEPPKYTASTLRSGLGDADAQFRAAMEQYGRGEYAAAAEGLRAVAESGAAARFYLAISDLMTGKAAEAADQLRAVVGMGDGPYLEQAQFFLAKALLAQNDAAGAKQALERTIALKGDRETEARGLLEQLR